MSGNWTDKDKSVVKNAVARVSKRASEDALKKFRAYHVDSVDQLWKLEQEIRNWRRDQQTIYVQYDDAERRLTEWIRRGWLKISEISNLSDDRLGRIKKKI